VTPVAAEGVSEWVLVSLAPWGRTAAIAAAVVAVVVVGLAWWSLGGEKIGRRLGLVSLRAGAAVAALVLFFQPALRQESVTTLPNHVAVLVDGSESMKIAEDSVHGPRAERARRWLVDKKAELAALGVDHRLDFYVFGDRLVPTTLESLQKDGAGVAMPATRIRDALAAARARYEGRDLAGILLFTDGVDTGRLATGLGNDDADFVRSLGAPVHGAWVGRRGLFDVAVARVLADEFAFVRTAIKVEAVVRVEGAKRLAGRALPVTLRRDGEIVDTASVTVEADQVDYRVSFAITPERVGKYVYEIAVPAQEGEALVENNARTFLLRVIRDKIRVLLVSGRPSWDERFLRGLFKHDPNVDLISFFILRTPDDVEAVSSEELSLIPFPTEELFQQQLHSFDVVFLQNFNFGPYGIGAYLDEIQRYVEDGGGLGMLGGDLSFTLGGYAGTPVATVLPVELPPVASTTAELVDPAPFKMQLTAEGRAHPMTALRIDLEDNDARWAAMPELGGTNLVTRAKAGATVLGTHPTRKGADGKPLPILTVGEAGKGRSLALTTDSSWRWIFSGGAVCQGDGCVDRSRAYQRFWENAVRWLIRDPSLSLLRIDTGEQSWRRGQPVVLKVKALRPDYQPAPDTDVAVTVTRLPGLGAPAAVVLAKQGRTDEHGVLLLELDPPAAGGYRVTARATLSGRPLQEDAVFLVDGAGRELEEAEARDELLRAISKASGGRFVDEGGPLGELPLLPPKVVRINKHHDVELWSSAWVLLVAAGCLGLEWLLRRRWGRV